ncbi:unnamed protein product [Penicillium salamii]|uniref:Enoyl reductase (ER) domain-containing protein n=1 Tax=Penicillium salamii TaxID=1612424 RepID=A0A9W4NJ81_9EURO|nr:unnamed protein product [Penicillium salamii]CAG7980000.1 unnamed protein product [Penicillium salamii]CAG8078952.1 unnamed protein product [Penicillium salamii]CAG8082574.1 unnamed protein product [Penicillium salamii]CAG8241482.1 unnamed protein product [Penicillium salamii]
MTQIMNQLINIIAKLFPHPVTIYPMAPANQAAWFPGPDKSRLEVKPAPYTSPDAGQMVVKNGAVAVNPIDWAKQFVGDKKWKWMTNPWILGEDVAGEVVEIGEGVTRFKVGDRVISHAVGFYVFGNRPEEGTFQLYTIVRENMTAPIPDSLSFERACVIPLACSAASCALYQKTYLELPYPTFPPAPLNGQYILITGGATSVGCNAIQLARASGYKVVTTCSPKNFPLVKGLGALYAFDYNSPALEEDIVAVLRDVEVVGAFAIGPGSVELSIEVLSQLGDSCQKIVAKASFPWPKDDPKNDDEYWEYMKWVDGWNDKISELENQHGIQTRFVEGAELGRNELGKIIYENFLPGALAGGGYTAAPEPQVIGNGLEYIQEALDVHKNGVSARKVVVSL